MANTMPFYKMFPTDWNRDLEEHPLEIEGAWIRICNKLWFSSTRGRLTKTIKQWARILRVDEKETERILRYLRTEKIGSIRFCNVNVTVVSRRQIREEKERQNTYGRVKKYRNKNSDTKKKQECKGNVTPKKSEVRSQKSEKEIDKEKTLPLPLSEIISKYQSEGKSVTPTIAEALKGFLEDYSAEWITKAIKEASLHSKLSIPYVRAILERWKEDGVSVGKSGNLATQARECSAKAGSFPCVVEKQKKYTDERCGECDRAKKSHARREPDVS